MHQQQMQPLSGNQSSIQDCTQTDDDCLVRRIDESRAYNEEGYDEGMFHGYGEVETPHDDDEGNFDLGNRVMLNEYFK